jgi:hypothetical protein
VDSSVRSRTSGPPNFDIKIFCHAMAEAYAQYL